MTVGAIDKEILAWVKKVWRREGKNIQEIEVRHARLNGAVPQLVRAFTEFDLYKSDELLAKALEEECLDHARQWSGTVIFEIAAFAASNRPLGLVRVRKKGEAEDDPETGDLPPGDRGSLRMYQVHEQIMFKETISALTAANTQLHKQVDMLIKQLADRDERVEKLIADYPTLIDLMSNLGDRSVERDIKRADALRSSKMKERAWDTIEKKILPELMGGGMSPKLEGLVKGLIADPERSMQIVALLKPEERAVFGELVAAYEPPDPPQLQPNGAG